MTRPATPPPPTPGEEAADRMFAQMRSKMAELGYDEGDYPAYLAAIRWDFRQRHRVPGPEAQPGDAWEEIPRRGRHSLEASGMLYELEAIHGNGSPEVRLVCVAIVRATMKETGVGDAPIAAAVEAAASFARGEIDAEALRAARAGCRALWEAREEDSPTTAYVAAAAMVASLHPEFLAGCTARQMAGRALRISWGGGHHAKNLTPESLHDELDLRADRFLADVIRTVAPHPCAEIPGSPSSDFVAVLEVFAERDPERIRTYRDAIAAYAEWQASVFEPLFSNREGPGVEFLRETISPEFHEQRALNFGVDLDAPISSGGPDDGL
jgi:hypothetical protein